MNKNDDEIYNISNQHELDVLTKKILNKSLFANKYSFKKKNYIISMFKNLNIDYNTFKKNNYYYDEERHLHISESESEFIWISTYGLCSIKKSTDCKEVNACMSQYIVISVLIDKSITIINSKETYNINSYNYEILSELQMALFNNVIFYIEVFLKAYISISKEKTENTHKLVNIYQKAIEVMFKNKHNDSIFQAQIIDPITKIIHFINTIPGEFKEHFVKYDDNKEESDIIIPFNKTQLNELKKTLKLSYDFILNYYHIGNNSHYLINGIYERLINKAQNKDEKNKITDLYQHLNSEHKSKSRINNITQ